MIERPDFNSPEFEGEEPNIPRPWEESEDEDEEDDFEEYAINVYEYSKGYKRRVRLIMNT